MLETVIDFLSSGSLVEYIAAGLTVIGSFRIITTMTPNTTDDKILNNILKVLNFLSAAIGKNKVN